MKGDKFIMGTYEYKMLNHVLNFEELSKLGSEGWELCGVLDQNTIIYYFKRKNGELMGISDINDDKNRKI